MTRLHRSPKTQVSHDNHRRLLGSIHPRIPLASLRLPLVFAEHLSFHHAANVLGTPQSSVRARIKAQEEIMGILLFERRHHGHRLKPRSFAWRDTESLCGRSIIFCPPAITPCRALRLKSHSPMPTLLSWHEALWHRRSGRPVPPWLHRQKSPSPLKELVIPLLDLVGLHVKLLGQLHQRLLAPNGRAPPSP